MTVSAFQAVVDGPAFFCDAAKRIFNQTDQNKHVLTTISSCLEVIKGVSEGPVLTTLSATCVVVTSFFSARGFVGKVNEFISGQLGTPLEISEDVFIPDVFKIVSKASMLVADICSTTKWLDCVGFDILSKISVSTATLGAVQTSFAVVGFLADMAVISRSIINEGFSIDSGLKIGSNITKLAFIVLFGSNVPVLMTLSFVANATSSVFSLTRFLITEYRV